jgi:hypothetical protein
MAALCITKPLAFFEHPAFFHPHLDNLTDASCVCFNLFFMKGTP